jgi:hypothetical protein
MNFRLMIECAVRTLQDGVLSYQKALEATMEKPEFGGINGFLVAIFADHGTIRATASHINNLGPPSQHKDRAG